MEKNLEQLLLYTAFSCMACDGEIAHEEVEAIKQMAIDKHAFGNLDVENELQQMVSAINAKGKGFLKQYLLTIDGCDFTKEEECSILQVALDTILADNVVKYSEVKFFKVLRSNLKHLSDKEILELVEGIDESFLAKDVKQSYAELFEAYFENIELGNLIIDELKTKEL